jgi:ketosteroid isomerase-like protein
MATDGALTERQRRNIAQARESFEAWTAGDRGVAISTLAEDVELVVPAELGNPIAAKGVEAFKQWTADWDEAWSRFEMSVKQIEPVGDRHVVLEVGNSGTGAGSGVEVETTLGWVLGVLEDGTCDYISLRLDFESARAVARERDASLKGA